jgi:hypothetical protein
MLQLSHQNIDKKTHVKVQSLNTVPLLEVISKYYSIVHGTSRTIPVHMIEVQWDGPWLSPTSSGSLGRAKLMTTLAKPKPKPKPKSKTDSAAESADNAMIAASALVAMDPVLQPQDDDVEPDGEAMEGEALESLHGIEVVGGAAPAIEEEIEQAVQPASGASDQTVRIINPKLAFDTCHNQFVKSFEALSTAHTQNQDMHGNLGGGLLGGNLSLVYFRIGSKTRYVHWCNKSRLIGQVAGVDNNDCVKAVFVCGACVYFVL